MSIRTASAASSLPSTIDSIEGLAAADPSSIEPAPVEATTQPHLCSSVFRTVTRESLRDDQIDDVSNHDEIRPFDDLISDPYYRITPPPSIEGRESPLLFAASFGQTSISHPIVTPLPTTMASQAPVNSNGINPPLRLPQAATPLPKPSVVAQPIIANANLKPPSLIHHPPPISIPRYTKSGPPFSSASNNNAAPSPPSSPSAENTGRWTAEEHRLFLQGLEEHGKGWKKIASLIQTRTVVQIRTHAQKYFQKLAKARANGDEDEILAAATSTTHHPHPFKNPVSINGSVLRNNGAPPANMASGTDSVSLAAAAGQIGTGSIPVVPRKRKSGGTKRRAIGSVVRSSVREGRTWKRQKMLETEPPSSDVVASASCGGADLGIPNPLPSISNILDPYVMAPPPVVGMTQSMEVGLDGEKRKKSRGRQQLVNTATHGTLPMAALEDAVFRLLTPAPGATGHTSAPQPPSNPSIVDPLAPNPVKISAPYNPQGQAAASSGTVPNSSPTCVTDMSGFPSWVDAKNPPAWYNEGADIDTLLDDAESLNWLCDTGDLDETYPPAVAAAASSAANEPVMDYEPTPVHVAYEYAYHPAVGASHVDDSRVPSDDVDDLEEIPVDPTSVHDPMTHHSVESLSFLVDSPKRFMEDMPTFLEEHAREDELQYAHSAEAEETDDADVVDLRESHNGLSFSDLDMGDEQAFVSALLDTSKESMMSFSKWGSQNGVADMGGLGEEEELHI